MPTRYAKTPPIRRGFPVRQFKALDEAHGIFSGYLAVFGNEDQVWADPLATGDIIEPGAFTKTLSDMRTRQQTRVAAGLPSGRYLMPIFWEHDDKDPVGGFTALREDKTGLYFEAELDLDIEQGRRAYSGLTRGYIPGMSFGYFVVKAMYDRQGRRHLKELSVYEGTVTPIPMNEEAVVLEIKNVNDDDSAVAPQDAAASTKEKGKSMGRNQRTGGQRPAHLPQTKAADFSTTLTGMLQGDTLQREWAKTFDAFVSCMWMGLLDAKYPLQNADGSTPDDPSDMLNGIVDDFAGSVKDLISRSVDAGFLPQMDDDGDSFDDPDDEPEARRGVLYGSDSDSLSLDTSNAGQKAGRTMSTANHKTMGGYLTSMKKSLAALAADHKALAAFHSKLEPGSNGADTTQGDAALKTGEDKSIADGATGAEDDADTAGAGRDTRDTTPLTADDIEQMIRLRLKVARASGSAY